MATDDVGKLYPVAKALQTPLCRASWRFDLQGLEHVPASGGAILCPNHTSVLDSFFVPALLPRRVTYVGKAEYMDSWKTKHIFPALGMIPIDREGGDAAERALSAAERVLRKGELFGIYPEGTRSRDGRLYRGHTGPARLALRAEVPIIPIGIVGAREVMPPDAKFPNLRRPVTIRFGRPISVARYADRAGDHLVLRQIIDEVMFEIRELSGQEYVNEYANKKKAAPAVVAARPAVVAVAGTEVGGNGQHPPTGSDAPVEEPVPPTPEIRDGDGDGGELGTGEFTRVTEARSSADLLRRPVRRAG
jgi:1-acyl-sn-glycerol-3-phosphate acyltransferase